MTSLITASGRKFDCGYFVTIPMPEMAYIRVQNTTFMDAAKVFSDKEETKVLTLGNDTFIGYTNIVSVSVEGNMILIALAKE